jgi:hypothetical protein
VCVCVCVCRTSRDMSGAAHMRLSCGLDVVQWIINHQDTQNSIYMQIYIYIYIYTWIQNMKICVCMHTYICIYVCVCVHMYTNITLQCLSPCQSRDFSLVFKYLISILPFHYLFCVEITRACTFMLSSDSRKRAFYNDCSKQRMVGIPVVGFITFQSYPRWHLIRKTYYKEYALSWFIS